MSSLALRVELGAGKSALGLKNARPFEMYIKIGAQTLQIIVNTVNNAEICGL